MLDKVKLTLKELVFLIDLYRLEYEGESEWSVSLDVFYEDDQAQTHYEKFHELGILKAPVRSNGEVMMDEDEEGIMIPDKPFTFKGLRLISKLKNIEL